MHTPLNFGAFFFAICCWCFLLFSLDWMRMSEYYHFEVGLQHLAPQLDETKRVLRNSRSFTTDLWHNAAKYNEHHLFTDLEMDRFHHFFGASVGTPRQRVSLALMGIHNASLSIHICFGVFFPKKFMFVHFQEKYFPRMFQNCVSSFV